MTQLGSPAMKMSKVGNQTNSQDPQAVNSRVFVGNLNTFQCSKAEVERMFQRYGRIAGESQRLVLRLLWIHVVASESCVHCACELSEYCGTKKIVPIIIDNF